jgi:hypothetical protein
LQSLEIGFQRSKLKKEQQMFFCCCCPFLDMFFKKLKVTFSWDVLKGFLVVQLWEISTLQNNNFLEVCLGKGGGHRDRLDHYLFWEGGGLLWECLGVFVNRRKNVFFLFFLYNI